ncbi:MAG TPA: hypothetical protein VKR42_05465 [Ktedonobacteraceae bacterium]|nr:hypothetical protein [Ktedonobacteraceae bacterium]
MAANPLASLLAHMQTWKKIFALYRLLDDKDVTFAFLMQPHEPQTRQQLEVRPFVLRVADTTGVDLSYHPQTTV